MLLVDTVFLKLFEITKSLSLASVGVIVVSIALGFLYW